jgi:hypothetical protein
MSKVKEVVAEWTIGQKVNRSTRNTFTVYTSDNEQWRRARDMHLNVEFKKRRVI